MMFDEKYLYYAAFSAISVIVFPIRYIYYTSYAGTSKNMSL